MKNILMIATGGTIASKEGDLGLTPAVTGEELAASVPGIKDIITTALSSYMEQTPWHTPPLPCLISFRTV